MKSISVLTYAGLSLCLAVLSACSGSNIYTYGYYTGKKRAPQPPEASRSSVNSTYHVVKKGQTLYSIAWQHGVDVRTLAQWNHIKAPYTIYPDQRLRTVAPPQKVTKVTRKAPRARAGRKHSTKTRSRPIKLSQVVKDHKNVQKIGWQWPTNGKIISGYSASDTGKKGLDIAGKVGQPIYAAATGRVVYSGNGLRGYGNLIIIKHNESYFSAYAHNRRLHVKEKQEVMRGQHIADMGNDEATRGLLHFEVRRDGKPVNPLAYLPKRR